MGDDRRLLIFELAAGGHYPSYIQHLTRYWNQQMLPGHLDVVVSPTFVQKHGDVIEQALCQASHSTLNFVPITPAEAAKLTPRNSPATRAVRSFQEWQLLQKYGRVLATTHCLLLYFDSFQAAIASGIKLPCAFSGIYFRPTFHYRTFQVYQPTLKEQVQEWRERLMLTRVLQHPQLQTLFCLDPFAIQPLTQFSRQVHSVYLPDPVAVGDIPEPRQLQQLRTRLGIAGDRRVLLLFGALYDPRKGVRQVLAAMALLSPEDCQQLCLLLVGQLEGQDSSIRTRVADLTQRLPIQVLIHAGYVPESDVQSYFHLADVVLAPYQRHVGMSGIVVQAAAAQKPIICSNYGLMGQLTRHWQLGLTVNAAAPAEIAIALKRCLQELPEQLGDRSKMAAFAQQNSAENFAQVIFQNLWEG
jgi:glycosyltransferase involved in cell wall biosynthesis